MFKLTEQELQNALDAIQHHGFSTLFPNPPEWLDVVNNWSLLKPSLAEIDLDIYVPFEPLIVFAPKSRSNLRVVTHLHPCDLLIYTALVLIIKNDIENARIEESEECVFSFRVDVFKDDIIYRTGDDYELYREELNFRANKSSCKYVAMADIVDFYPRIYQHRLENAISAIASKGRSQDIARVLVKKFLSKLSGGVSYGIPVGPYASRLLAEALLIDVDDFLKANNFEYVRWVDDFTFFCKSDVEAQHALFVLAEWLSTHHGLTLHGVKTKLVTDLRFLKMMEDTHEDRLAKHSEELGDLFKRMSPYADVDELDDEEIDNLGSVDYGEILKEALDDRDDVDYELAAFILGQVSLLDEFEDSWRYDLAKIVIANISDLYPVIDSVAKFFCSFEELSEKRRALYSNALLEPILNPLKAPPPDYYVMWVLSIFMSDSEWNNCAKILKIFKSATSEVIKRYAALALAITGTRSQALAIRDSYSKSSPLVQLAILKACAQLGDDERLIWKKKMNISGLLERKII